MDDHYVCTHFCISLLVFDNNFVFQLIKNNLFLILFSFAHVYEYPGRLELILQAKVKGSRTSQAVDAQEQPAHMPCVVVTAERLDIQLTTAMYTHRLVSVVSKMTIPSENLLHHCHAHLHCQVHVVVSQFDQMVDTVDIT